MASYLQAQHHDAWRTTMYPLPTIPTESEAKWNTCARNHIFEALDEELFDRVFALQTAHEVWMELKEIHVGNKKIREEKYELLKLELNEFKMKDDEGVEKMYSRNLSMGCNRSRDVIILCRIIYLSSCVEYTLMLKVRYHAVKGVKASMLPWIHSIRRVHHR
jgi:hypothetical protein